MDGIFKCTILSACGTPTMTIKMAFLLFTFISRLIFFRNIHTSSSMLAESSRHKSQRSFRARTIGCVVARQACTTGRTCRTRFARRTAFASGSWWSGRARISEARLATVSTGLSWLAWRARRTLRPWCTGTFLKTMK